MTPARAYEIGRMAGLGAVALVAGLATVLLALILWRFERHSAARRDALAERLCAPHCSERRDPHPLAPSHC